MTKWDLSRNAKVNGYRIKDKNYIIILIDIEKKLAIHHTFVVKILNKVGIWYLMW